MAAEPFSCAHCRRRIGKTKTHFITETGYVCCSSCVFRQRSTRDIHARLYPDCPVHWHDLWDHQFVQATRAGARWWLRRREQGNRQTSA